MKSSSSRKRGSSQNSGMMGLKKRVEISSRSSTMMSRLRKDGYKELWNHSNGRTLWESVDLPSLGNLSVYKETYLDSFGQRNYTTTYFLDGKLISQAELQKRVLGLQGPVKKIALTKVRSTTSKPAICRLEEGNLA